MPPRSTPLTKHIPPALHLLALPLAMLAASAAQAQSSVQLYGTVDSYVGSLKRADQSASTAVLNGGGAQTSYIGFRGSEALGGGLSANFTLESFLQPDTGAAGRNASDPFWSKKATVGLSGGFGAVALGRQANLLYLATGVFNPFALSLQFSPVMLQNWIPTYNRNLIGDTIWNNTVSYSTPLISGFRAEAMYSLGEAATNNGTNNVGLALNYNAGPFAATLVANQAKVGAGFTTAVPKQTSYMAGVTYDFKIVKLFGTFVKSDARGLDIDTRNIQAGVSVPVGPGNLLFSWSNNRREARGAADVKRDLAALGYNYRFSKRTEMYGTYLYDKFSNTGSAGSFGVGVRHQF